MYVEGGHDHDDHDHDDKDDMGSRKLAGHLTKESYIMINEAKVILADITDDTKIFHGIDTVLLSTETFECPTKAPTEAPVASPTNAPVADEGSNEDEKNDEKEDDSSASFAGFSVASLTAIVALSAFVF